MTDYDVLFQPIRLGQLELKNRIVMAPMGTNFGDGSGHVCEETVQYYTRRARGGVGLITTEAMYVHPSGAHRTGAMGIDCDELIPGLTSLTDAVHAAGGKIAAQLTHAGRVVGGAVRPADYARPWGPSALPHRKTGEMSHAMTTEEIRTVVKAFGAAAVRAKRGGFDAVEVHGTHGYLLMQFMSPLWNRRADEYGGSLENRMRFPIEVVEQIRESVGPDYPVIYRMGGSELLLGGMTLDHALALAVALEKAGVSAFHVSGGINETPEDMKNSIGTNYAPKGYFLNYAACVKKAVTVPVIAVGRLGDPDVAACAIAEHKSDMVCLGRQLLADPEWPNKVRENRTDEIVRCISCNRGCIEELCLQHSITCVQNPALGHETSPAVPPEKKKHILVAGAGLAGLEFAIQAALRGHSIEIWEARSFGGGQCTMAAQSPHKEDFQCLVDSRLKKLDTLGVPVSYNKTVTARDSAGFDLVAVCTGNVSQIPPFAWKNNPIVYEAFPLLQRNYKPPEKGSTAVVVGGGAVGLETAHLLADRGFCVHVIELADHIGNGFVPTAWAAFCESCASLDLHIHTCSQVKDIVQNTVVLELDGKETALTDVAMVVIAVGSRPDRSLLDELQKANVPCINIGGSNGAMNTLDVVCQAYEFGRIV